MTVLALVRLELQHLRAKWADLCSWLGNRDKLQFIDPFAEPEPYWPATASGIWLCVPDVFVARCLVSGGRKDVRRIARA
jgi:hypothetical protein